MNYTVHISAQWQRLQDRGGHYILKAITFVAACDPSPSRQAAALAAIVILRDYLPMIVRSIRMPYASPLA
jgi:hypothetical protein